MINLRVNEIFHYIIIEIHELLNEFSKIKQNVINNI